MSLNKQFFERETNITAKVICDSVSGQGDRITTLEIEYPRFILGEINTHRMLSKNSSSSRAIPFGNMVRNIQKNIALPLYWGSAKAGMQAGVEIEDIDFSKKVWGSALDYAVGQASLLDDENLHKQLVNRLLEPFQMMKTVITGTEWDNFFNLRLHPDAQPEFCMLAYKIYQAINESTSNVLRSNEWHLPYVNTYRVKSGRGFDQLEYYVGEIGTESYRVLTLEEAQRISASCCAQVSYRKNDDSLEKANKIFDVLIDSKVLHASPFEHLATPIRDQSKNINGWDTGITHSNREGKLFSGNLQGWISYRHLLPNNTCNKFDYEERMKCFED